MLIEVNLNQKKRYKRVNTIDLKVIVVMNDHGLR